MTSLMAWSDLGYFALGVIAVVVFLCLFAAPPDYLPAPTQPHEEGPDL